MKTMSLSMMTVALFMTLSFAAEARMASSLVVFSMCETYEECDPIPPENPDDPTTDDSEYPPI